ncbi:hypothetical protein chiPu_0026041 [Chiloscyllium punctatum]|uniref:Uncharacterized protein n=1 Tax=Chiloscyllium punctatum TaxID=137246 RepID=A0A401TIF4_CHIPU|nr:hypothetical protein [Chiloscyllium punctatum]
MARPHRQRASPHLLVGRQRLTADGRLADTATVRELATRTSLTTFASDGVDEWPPLLPPAPLPSRGDVHGANSRDRRPSPIHGGRRISEVPAAYSSGRVSPIPALSEAWARR